MISLLDVNVLVALLLPEHEHHVTAQDWDELLQRAANETGSTLRLRNRLGQASDHPVLVNVPETEYLRGYVLEKVHDKTA